MIRTFPHQRIAIVGTTGSGKTTLGRDLSRRSGIPHIELDALYWEPNWTPAEVAIFRDRVEQVTQGSAWITDGNYRSVRDIVWRRAEALVWLDYDFFLGLGRLLRRTLYRIYSREELWSGNRENAWNQVRIWSDDSLINWFFKSYWRRKREIPQLLANSEYRHLKAFHFKSPKETADWLAALASNNP